MFARENTIKKRERRLVHWFHRVMVVGTIATMSFAVKQEALADVFRWDNGRVIPGTIGVSPGPGVNLSDRPLHYAELYFRDLTGAQFASSDLSWANLQQTELAGADFSGANLTWVRLYDSTLANAKFSDAVVDATRFDQTTEKGFVKEQLYSTRNYQEGRLRGIGLSNNDLSGWDFRGQDLSAADFTRSMVFSTDFTGATVQSAGFNNVTSQGFTKEQLYSTASYQARQLAGIELASNQLTNWDFRDQDLTNARFWNSTLSFTKFDGAEIVGADFSETTAKAFHPQQFYSTASYQRGDLRGVVLENNDLSGWDFSGQDLRGARVNYSTVADADFTNANVTGAALIGLTSRGFTKEQLYSTASYQAKNLRSTHLSSNDLRGWDFSGQDLTGAFLGAQLENADLTGATIRDAALGTVTANQLYSTASYQNRDLRGMFYSNQLISRWDLRDQDLRGADLSRSSMLNTDFTNARIEGVNFQLARSFRQSQLYSTASYQSGNLRGVTLYGLDLDDWDFRGQDMTGSSLANAELAGAKFDGAWIGEASLDGVTDAGFTKEQLYATASYETKELPRIGMRGNNLDGWDFRGQNLMNSGFQVASFNQTDFRYADLRGIMHTDFSTALLDDAIRSDGSIAGLSLGSDERLVIRNYRLDAYMFSSDDPISVLVRDEMSVDGGTLRFHLDADDWTSTVAFQPDADVSIDGVLELAFAAGVDTAAQAGRSFRLFDWTGVERMGEFTVHSPYVFDTSDLYSTGEVRLVSGLPGDTNADNRVDIEDLNAVRNNFGSVGELGRPGDAIPFDGVVDLSDLNYVRNHFGEVNPIPEPASIGLAVIALLGCGLWRIRSRV